MNGKRTCGSLKDIKAVCPHCKEKNFVSHKSTILKYIRDESQRKLLVISCWKCRLDIDCDLNLQKDWY